jgi:hypothetical protein
VVGVVQQLLQHARVVLEAVVARMLNECSQLQMLAVHKVLWSELPLQVEQQIQLERLETLQALVLRQSLLKPRVAVVVRLDQLQQLLQVVVAVVVL